MEGLFVRHEGYCGALGAFLATLQSRADEEEARGGAGAARGDGGDDDDSGEL